MTGVQTCALPIFTLRVGAEEIPVRAGFVEDDALRERIAASFREKYGWIDGVIAWFRGARPRILRLSPR